MYKDKLDEIMYSVNNKAISTKILQYMAKIRNNDDDGQARRFVWELIQNAKDVAQEDIPLRIRITHSENKLVFAHNGKSFLLKNILSLINQVSGKSDDSKTTGKFGTGFITTHLLAEKVTVRGVLEDFGLEPKRFEVLIDRSGKDDDEVISAVDLAMDSLRNIDDTEPCACDRCSLNTEFEYYLETEYSRKVASIGVNDAAANLFYCMAFVPQVYEVILDDRVNGVINTYRRESIKQIDGTVSYFMIYHNDVSHKVVVASDGTVSIAVMVDSDNCIVPITEKSSRLFCDFPLIDTVPFPFPAVANSSSFRVNEPRSCITLTDNPNSTDSETNKQLMCSAVKLYDSLLAHLVNNGCKKLYDIVYTPDVFSRSDISEQWVKDNIVSAIAECVADKPMFHSRQGVFSAKECPVYIPNPSYPDMASDMNELLYGLGYPIIEEDVLEWAAVLSKFNSKLFVVKHVKDLLSIADGADTIGALKELIVNGCVYSWLKQLYLCAVKDENIRNEINVGKYKIIPVQNRTMRPINEVYRESVKIDEYFKDISEAIDRYLKTDERLLLRRILVDENLDIDSFGDIPEFELSRLEYTLKHGTRNSIVNNEVTAVRRSMAACIADEKVYDIYCYVDNRLPKRYVPELKLSSSVWDNTLIAMENVIINFFRYYDGNQILFKSEERKQRWIDIINYYYEVKGRFDTLAYKEGPVLTEQPDDKCFMHIIRCNPSGFAKIQDIDDLMIEIYQQIIPDGIRLIDRRITLDRSMNVDIMNEFKAATLVSNKITTELNDGALHTKPRAFQAACSLLLRWINQHEERAKELFPAFSSKEKRMQLLTAEQAAVMSENLDIYENIMKKYALLSVDELETKLKELEKNKSADTAEDNSIPEEYYGFGYSDEADNFEEITKLVGEIGEALAVDILKGKYGIGATVTLYNSDSYKQEGYDITVTIPGKETLYYEIKTRTASSRYRYCLNFSHSQARRLHDSNYHVMLVVIDGNKQLVDHCDFDDIFEGFAGGNFIRSDGYSIITK